MPSARHEARNYLLACYTVHLILGHTIKSIRIKHATLRKYINVVVKLHTDRDLPSPLSHVKDDLVTPLLNSVKSYEHQKNRKEMITDAMMSHMLRLGRLSSSTSLDAAILDWIILCRLLGARRSEWCQESQSIEMTEPTFAHPIPQPKAFTLEDFQFFDSSGQRIHTLMPSHSNSVDYVEIRWRFQKNKDNGQKIPYKRDYDRPDVCPVLSALRICLRAISLQVSPTSPLAVYASQSSTSSFRFITAAQVHRFLRLSAQAVFNLNPKDKSLASWTCHSLRVTAANLLHRAGMSDSYIQTRLRWKSNTFLMYLRNTFYSADQHTEALQLSNRNLPHIQTPDGLRYRPLEDHERFIAAQQSHAPAA